MIRVNHECEPFLMAMGRRLREARQDLRLSLDEVAARTELSKTCVWETEMGKTMPGAATLWRLSRTLRCSIDYIVTGEE